MQNKIKICRIVLLCLSVLTIGCSKDSYNIQETQKDKSTIVSQRTITGTEALAIGQKLSSSLNSMANKTATNYGTIDYSEIKNVVNTNGKENYTFRILNHPENSETVFFNLVVTQREGYTTIMLMKYEMDPAFAEAYYTKNKSFTQFGGTVTTSLISSNDPCPPVVVPPVVIPYGGDAPDTTPDQGSDGSGLPSIPLFTILDANDNSDGNSGTGTGTGTGTTTESTGTNGCHCAPQGSNFKIAVNNGNDAEDPCPKNSTAGILSPEALASFIKFRAALPDDIENWLSTDTNHLNSYLFHYLYDNGFSDESKQFATEMIALAYANNATFKFDNTITASNALVFNNVNEFETYIDNENGDTATFEYDQDQKISKAKIKVSAFYDLEIDVKQSISPYSVLNVTSEITGITFGHDWKQTDYSVNVENNTVTVDIYGISSVSLFIDGIGTVYAQNRHYQLKINKTTGRIFGILVL